MIFKLYLRELDSGTNTKLPGIHQTDTIPYLDRFPKQWAVLLGLRSARCAMGNDSQSTGEARGRQDDLRDEVRTIGFRMREIQRLLGVRIEQENRRLEQEGLDPVTRPRFRDEGDEPGETREE